MSDLRAIAERVLAIEEAGREPAGDPALAKAVIYLFKGELDWAKTLARAVLSSLDVPAAVREAMERLRIMNEKYSLADPYGETGISIGSSHHPYWKDCEKIADHFLANPIRIDVPEREQLLKDVETVERYGESYREPTSTDDRAFLNSSKRLAAYTRRTLKGK